MKPLSISFWNRFQFSDFEIFRESTVIYFWKANFYVKLHWSYDFKLLKKLVKSFSSLINTISFFSSNQFMNSQIQIGSKFSNLPSKYELSVCVLVFSEWCINDLTHFLCFFNFNNFKLGQNWREFGFLKAVNKRSVESKKFFNAKKKWKRIIWAHWSTFGSFRSFFKVIGFSFLFVSLAFTKKKGYMSTV